jgi:hypothetical protein
MSIFNANQFDHERVFIGTNFGISDMYAEEVGCKLPNATSENGVEDEEPTYVGLRQSFYNDGKKRYGDFATPKQWMTFTEPVLNMTCNGLELLVMTSTKVFLVDTRTKDQRLLCCVRYNPSVSGGGVNFGSSLVGEELRAIPDALAFSDDGSCAVVCIGPYVYIFDLNIDDFSSMSYLPGTETYMMMMQVLRVESRSWVASYNSLGERVTRAEISPDNKTILLSGDGMVVQILEFPSLKFKYAIGGLANPEFNQPEITNSKRMLQQQGFVGFSDATFVDRGTVMEQEGVMGEGGIETELVICFTDKSSMKVGSIGLLTLPLDKIPTDGYSGFIHFGMENGSCIQVRKGGGIITLLNSDTGALNIFHLRNLFTGDSTFDKHRQLAINNVYDQFLVHASGSSIKIGTAFWDNVTPHHICVCNNPNTDIPCPVVGHETAITALAFAPVNVNNKKSKDAFLFTGSADKLFVTQVPKTLGKRTICAAKIVGEPTCVAFVNSPFTDRARALALAMGLHERLGAGTAVNKLDDELCKMICLIVARA